MRKQVKVHIETLSPDIQLPAYATPNDSGLDIRASENVMIHPQETKIVPTGIKVAIPEGYEIQVRARSGISLNTPLRVANGVGTLDAGFRGEVGVIIYNSSIPEDSKTSDIQSLESKGNMQASYYISKGDRIAQLVIQDVPQIVWEQVDSVKDIGEDRGGGFGSSAIK